MHSQEYNFYKNNTIKIIFEGGHINVQTVTKVR